MGDQTSQQWDQTEGEMDATTAKKIDYSNLEELSMQKVTCRMPYSDEKGAISVKIALKNRSAREEDTEDLVTGQSKNASN